MDDMAMAIGTRTETRPRTLHGVDRAVQMMQDGYFSDHKPWQDECGLIHVQSPNGYDHLIVGPSCTIAGAELHTCRAPECTASQHGQPCYAIHIARRVLCFGGLDLERSTLIVPQAPTSDWADRSERATGCDPVDVPPSMPFEDWVESRDQQWEAW